MKSRIRLWVLCVLCLGSGSAALADAPQDAGDIQYAVDIPAQDLGNALQAFALASQHKLLYSSELVAGKTSTAVKGQFTTEEGLRRLLAKTGLRYEVTNSGLVMIRAAGTTVAPVDSAAKPAQDPAAKEGKSDSSGTFPGAQAALGQASSTAAAVSSPAGAREQATELQEVIVTAEKRTERLQDVPMAVSVLDAQSLLASNQTQLHEYFNQIPGLALAQSTIGPSIVSIRGITSGINQNPTVGFTVDDIPLGASTNNGAVGLVPEISPADLARVEVLKGPQGTLYGASSMGGLIRYVTVDPSPQESYVRIQAGTDAVFNGRQLGYNMNGSVNVPLGDSLAMRASGFVRRSPGYIDNVQTGERGVNGEDVSGGRISALWSLSPDFTLKVSALLENDNRHGSNDVDVPTAGFPQTSSLRDLQQSYLIGTGKYDRQTQIYSAMLNGHVGSLDLTAVSGYNVNSFSASEDLSFTPLGALAAALFGPENSGTPFPNSGQTDKFTQELRVTTSLGGHLDLLAGAFYTHERSAFHQSFPAVNAVTGMPVGSLYEGSSPTAYQEYAGFADLTWKLSERFDVQFGGRESHLTETALESSAAGPLVPSGPTVTPEHHTSSNVFTYLVTPRLRLSSDILTYARVASGYRAGGSNGNLCTVAPFPCGYAPDKTEQYELGLKGDFLDRKLSVDTSVYYIGWKDLQLDLRQGTFAYTGNGSRAKSEGIELTLESHPVSGLTASGWIAWNEAVLTEALPSGSAYGLAGDRLPYAARISGNLSLQQDFPIARDYTAYLGAKVIWVGDRVGELTASAARQALPGYAQADLRAGLTWRAWSFGLYANNIADRRGALFGGVGTAYPFAFQYIQPRTVGVEVTAAL